MGLEPRKPHQITVDLEEEFYQVIKTHRLKMTTFVNHGVEDLLRREGLIE